LTVSRRSVFRWAEQHDTGRALETRQPGSGRPRVLSPAQLRQLKTAVDKPGFVARRWAQERGLNVKTVCNALKRFNKVARVRPRTVLLRPPNVGKRLAFAREMSAKPLSYWRRWTFTDSKWFAISSKGRQFAWVTAGSKPPTVPKAGRDGVKIHVYAAVNVHGVSEPIILPEGASVDAPRYIADILPGLVKFSKRTIGANHIFQQDGARAHTARLTRDWFAESADVRASGVVGPDRWPPQSPDLNVIEHLWSVLAERVSRRRPTTRIALERAVKAEFAAVDPAMCRRLVESMPRRVTEVVARGGMPLARGSCGP
jgi:transposase